MQKQISDSKFSKMGIQGTKNKKTQNSTLKRHLSFKTMLSKARHKRKIFSDSLNQIVKESSDEELTAAWAGIIFNEIIYWASTGFKKAAEELAERITAITSSVARRSEADQ